MRSIYGMLRNVKSGKVKRLRIEKKKERGKTIQSFQTSRRGIAQSSVSSKCGRTSEENNLTLNFPLAAPCRSSPVFEHRHKTAALTEQADAIPDSQYIISSHDEERTDHSITQLPPRVRSANRETETL